MAIKDEIISPQPNQHTVSVQNTAATPELWTTIGQVVAFTISVAITVTIFLLRDRIGELAVYGYTGVLFTTLLSNATVFVPAPTMAVLFAVDGGLMPVLVGLAAGLGATGGEMVGFLAGVGGRVVMQERPLYQRIQRWMRRYGVTVIFFLALIPNPIFDVGGVIAGAMKVPASKFAVATVLGKSLRFIILALGTAWYISQHGGLGF